MISVVIPTRHRNDSLAECLRRLAPGVQTLPAERYEVIVTDDGSDTTAEAMVRERFPWARWTAGPRRGPAANRNHGVSVARGDWIAFTDDDCLPSAGWLAAYAAAIEARVGPVLEGRTTCDAGLRSILDEAPVNLTGGNLWSCNLAMDRETFNALGQFDERFPGANAEDVEFHARVRRVGLGVVFVPEAVVDHPPRPRRRGIAAGRAWEGRALLQILEPQSLAGSLPLHVAKVRISQLIAMRPSMAWLRFAWSSVLETATVAIAHRRWAYRYAGVTRVSDTSGGRLGR